LNTDQAKPRTVAIIQARMGSSRLPGKVLLDIAGLPMLALVVERTKRARTVDKVVVATTTEPNDDLIASLCHERGYSCYRGSLHDVLDRYYQAAKIFNAEIIVRITADCPLIDPQVIDQTVYAFLGNTALGSDVVTCVLPPGRRDGQLLSPYPESLSNGKFAFDFAANRLPPPWGRTYPIGLDTEVCSFHVLEIAWKEARQPHHREHVMPYFYEHPDRFRVVLVNYRMNFGKLRWTVDTAEDLELVRQIFARFPERLDFSWLETLDLFEREPALAQINTKVQHKHYLQVDDRRINQ
jgi:spore coat polysaccharide biosynthesis protein SpsF